MKKTAKELKEEVSPEGKIIALQKELAASESELKNLKGRVSSSELFVDRIIQAVVASKPYPKVRISTSKTKPIVSAIVKFSDWQIGEVINAKETEGFGNFDFDIAQKRIFRITSSIIKWVKTMRTGYRINDLHIFGEGDWISGDIHDELRITNEFPLPVQTAKAGNLLGEVMLMLAPHFENVIMWQVAADNHGRLVKKVQHKQRAINNMSYLVYAIANAKTERCNNITIKDSLGIKTIAVVENHKFLITHGNDVKSWMGIPYYGLSRGIGREAKKRMKKKMGMFDLLSIGHWHVPSVVEDMIFVNGCLTGTTEFDHSQGRHAEPSQCAMLISKKHGYFNWTAFRGE